MRICWCGSRTAHGGCLYCKLKQKGGSFREGDKREGALLLIQLGNREEIEMEAFVTKPEMLSHRRCPGDVMMRWKDVRGFGG